MKVVMGTVFGVVMGLGLAACSDDVVQTATATEAPKVAQLGKVVKRKGSWCDVKQNEVSLGHANVRGDETDLLEAVASPTGDAVETGDRTLITYCSTVLK